MIAGVELPAPTVRGSRRSPRPLRVAFDGMKALLACLIAGFASLAAAGNAPITLHRVEPRPTTACGCEFFKPAKGGGHEFDPLVALGVNEQPPFAVVNLGRGNLKLDRVQNSGGGGDACSSGEKWQSRWRTGDVVLELDLSTTGPGEESCGFNGTVSVTQGQTKASFPVRGACGC